MKKIFISLFAASALLLMSCSTETVSPWSGTFEGDTEFSYNYGFLYYYYYKAGEELGEEEEYLDSPYTTADPQYADIVDVLVMYQSMSDLMTTYYPSTFFEELSSLLTESETVKSFGMELDSALVVKYVYKVGPAATADVRRGDRLFALDGTLLDGDSLYQKLLDDSSTDSFRFSMLRGKDTLELQMTRTELLSPTVYVDSLDGVPILRVTAFMDNTNGYSSAGTALEFESALRETDGATSSVIDMRGNGGGSVNLCERMAKDLLPANDTVIIQKTWGPEKKGKKELPSNKEEFVVASENGIGAGRYYVLMLDSGSASCTEIFAAALASNLKTPIVGTNSYGKGIGQIYTETPEKGFGVATSFLFYDKDGGFYHTHGFVPDYYIPDEDSALATAVELAKAKVAKRTEGYSDDVQPFWQRSKSLPKRTNSPEDAIEQMKRGLAVQEVFLPR